MKKTVLLTLLFALLISCSDQSAPTPERTNGYAQGPKTKEDSLFQEIMDGHDAAMAKMGKLKGYRKEATQKADSLAKLKSLSAEAMIKSLRTLAENLQASENNMNAWMEGFTVDSASNDKIRRIAYLESEKIKVIKVSGDVLSSVAAADSLLKK